MKRTSASIVKAALIFSALCAPASVQAAPQWDYALLDTATNPDAYPGGAWKAELYLVGTDTITPVNGRVYFNLADSLFFYGRGEQEDLRVSASDFTFEWRQEVLSPGAEFSMGMYSAEEPGVGIDFIYSDMFLLRVDDNVIVLPEVMATGTHTYRLVKSEAQVELYVDGALAAELPTGAYAVDHLELSGWGMWFAPYEAYWGHVAYTRGAYSPAELPSPTEPTAGGGNTIAKRDGDAPVLADTGVLSGPLVSYVTGAGGDAASGVDLSFSITRYPPGATGQELTKAGERTSADGLADVQLRLGNIPAEYDVRAECASCDPEAGSVTFTCCGKLPNDRFSQSGQAWSPTCYANNDCRIDPDATIGWRGCALTSLATLINYYSDSVHPVMPRTDPGDLNTYLRGLPVPDGYDSNNDVNFRAIESYSVGRVSFVGSYDVGKYYSAESLLDLSDGLIRSGMPLIFRVEGHFVLVIGKCGDNFIVADPAGGQERLYDPANPQGRPFRGLRIFSRH
ncbi:MAG: hypothetical protein AB1734_03295 [Elusimicrobiota bacterium]